MTGELNGDEKNIETVGGVVEKIDVQLSARFLEHFSEQLYSSPNKAFEELISNSWDAGAKSVYINIPDDLEEDSAAITVLDDGESMDASGLHDLWKVAYSNKRETHHDHERPLIGKFGIGKLSTYVLANKLTYICKAKDGVIRIVTMNYGDIEPKKSEEILIDDLFLDMREVDFYDLEVALSTIEKGGELVELIKKGVPVPADEAEWEDEFGGNKLPDPPSRDTWTLAILSSLKPQGKTLKRGVIRRMMQTALPLGSQLNIVFNDEHLGSSKLDKNIIKEWIIGPDLDLDEIKVPPEAGDEGEEEEFVKIESSEKPYPHINIPSVGEVTGSFKIYEDNVSGGKSDVVGASNGFHINVLGRVTNEDPAFGEKDLSHSAWARFRMTVRADGLDKHLAVNREQFFQKHEIRVFRAFLRKAFNIARSRYDDVIESAWPDAGQALVDHWGTLPLKPLRNAVQQAVSGHAGVQGLIDSKGINDLDSEIEKWERETKEDERKIVTRVDFDARNPDAGIAYYQFNDRSILINTHHPFVQEHFSTHEEQRVVRNLVLADFLTDVHAIDMGIEPEKIEEIRRYRDNVAALIAQIDRRSGVGIARILIEMSTYRDSKAFEIIVSDALEYLGFSVERLATPGEPEGVARAYPTPSPGGEAELYCFTFDAKSSKRGKVKTGNVGVAGLARHRRKHDAEHTLVVAPEFEVGGLVDECKSNTVTPMRASDLGRLLQLTAELGAIPLTKLRDVFKYFDPEDVTGWVSELEQWHKEQRQLTLDVFLESLMRLENNIPDALDAGLIAHKCRDISMNAMINKSEVTALARGLQILIPDLIRVQGQEIIVSAHPEKVADAVSIQLKKIHTASAKEYLK